MSALRSPNENERRISASLIITMETKSDAIALTRQRRTRTRIMRKVTREGSGDAGRDRRMNYVNAIGCAN